ncbi:PGF-CTERM sorting domain-containing protein [Haladaptatus sp. DYF46]|uniref:PGF-CTERM sorting domain-containing protein n=1 Tax=Haladaptatus sp. DYF46 TaxID=2886041 RepID=UPI001E354734|nr:PGF-CTERM sorting domain-containing protein [Haladaptatus sp. DYF46]
MHSKRILVLAVVLTICAVPVTVSAAANDVSNAPLAQQETTTTTDTMGNGTMNDSMTTTTDSMGDDEMTTTGTMGDDEMTTTDSMDDGTTDGEMTTTDTMDDETMTDDQMTDDGTTDDTNDGGSGNSDTSLPGFGIGVALVALVAGALFVARNR